MDKDNLALPHRDNMSLLPQNRPLPRKISATQWLIIFSGGGERKRWRLWAGLFLRLLALAYLVYVSYGNDASRLGMWAYPFFAVLGMWLGMAIETILRDWK